MRKYLEHCADQRLAALGMAKHYGANNPFSFLSLQDVQEVTNFFERRGQPWQRDFGLVILDGSQG